jgi:NADPH-dependent glutamate synthase beta subunit-like oxidoreductase
MTLRVAIAGAGPAGFAVASSLLAYPGLDVKIDLVDRAVLPDGLLRHGPAAGAHRLRDVARGVDAVIGDARVTYYGDVDVGAGLPLQELRSSADAVVLATGAPNDLPLQIAGRDSVGIGTISHVEAWLAGNADVKLDELDLAMDTAVLFGVSPATLRVAEVLCGRTPTKVQAEVAERLTNSSLHHVQLVDPREGSEVNLPAELPAMVVIRAGLTPVGVVGRNRARAVRCLHKPDRYGGVVSEDLRAQLLLRPRAESFCWHEIDQNRGNISHHESRVLIGEAPAAGLYVAGWAGRAPSDKGSHFDDAAAVVAAIHADIHTLSRPRHTLADAPVERSIAASGVDGWSAVEAINVLRGRFAGEGKAPLAITGRWSTRLMRIEPTRNTPESENVEACPHRTRGARLLVRESLSAPALPMWVYDSPWR